MPFLFSLQQVYCACALDNLVLRWKAFCDCVTVPHIGLAPVLQGFQAHEWIHVMHTFTEVVPYLAFLKLEAFCLRVDIALGLDF